MPAPNPPPDPAFSTDTIAAIATPLGEGGLGVVRLSGPSSFGISDRIFQGRSPLSGSASHRIRHGKIMDGSFPVDEAVALLYRAPRSYTGEDVVELCCHGGAYLVKKVLSLALSAGARMAEPGEFTRRAYLNGKMDLLQAEAVADLIHAQSEMSRRLSSEQLEGGLSRKIREIKDPLLHLLAQVEANIDFVDDEVPALSKDGIRETLDAMLETGGRLLEAASAGRILREGLRVALVGKPNAGKSSLFNALLGEDRSIVTPSPGTTRDTVEEKCLLEGVPAVLTDTAGFRQAADRAEEEGVLRAGKAVRSAEVAVCVLDGSTLPDDEDRRAAEALRGHARVVAAVNKSDKPQALAAADLVKEIFPRDVPWVSTSAMTGEGLPDLRKAVINLAGMAPEAVQAPGLINLRHKLLFESALKSLAEARKDLKSKPEECLAVPLREALGFLNMMTGESATEEILDAIFSKFCIGK